jgi:hypothetical protein
VGFPLLLDLKFQNYVTILKLFWLNCFWFNLLVLLVLFVFSISLICITYMFLLKYSAYIFLLLLTIYSYFFINSFKVVLETSINKQISNIPLPFIDPLTHLFSFHSSKINIVDKIGHN